MFKKSDRVYASFCLTCIFLGLLNCPRIFGQYCKIMDLYIQYYVNQYFDSNCATFIILHKLYALVISLYLIQS